jgi:3-hydroxyacyl-CoA dehydrogenase/enoyl-CoA hydratase/3-hydroxybutyryl-CoA epimerase
MTTNIRREILEDGLCVLTFDRPESSANIFDRATLEELGHHLDVIASVDSRVRSLVLVSAKEKIFVAGADLHGIRTMTAEQLSGFIALGQEVFSKLAALTIPTVAAIHGAAVGGGYEVALACDWRVASPDASTKIGLPETQLGIIPAWGGSTRLPRLIGVPGALDIILGGKTVAAKHALKLGMVDEVAPRGSLFAAARVWLKKGKRAHGLAHSAPVNAAVDFMIAPRVRHQVEDRTHGHYPAVKKAMEVVMEGASDWNEAKSLARERAAVAELIQTPETKNLLSLFFLQERAKRRAVAGVSDPGRKAAQAAVIGAGVMGAGIAQWLSARGLRVILRDIDAARVAAGMASAASLYAAGVKRRVFTEREARAGLARISPAPAEVPLRRCDIVIEAAVEKMPVKQTIFRRLDELVSDDTILATNTSALSIAELAAATKRPERVIGIHFFNPVHRMQLVEVVTGPQTSPEITQRALRFVQQLGKLPVLVKDSPGFVVNRVLLPYLTEAARLFEQGASVETLDRVMIDFGMPMGPLRLIDEVGTDIAADVAATLSAAYPQRMAVPEILRRMIAAGALGKKAGKGFYTHQKGADPQPNREFAAAVSAGDATTFTASHLGRRMVLPMVNEAARCLEEGVVETAGDIDFAMVMGTGWAPFRGGPLRYADALGAEPLVAELSRLADKAGPAFQPCALLTEMARDNRSFYED